MRDARIELFRCICMLGVVFLHALTQGGYAESHRGLDNLMVPSVVGFVFISGYFGIRCKVKSVLKLLGIGLASLLMVMILNLDFSNSYGIGGFWWFLWMYLALMAMAPLADMIFEKWSARDAILKIAPFAVVVYVWSYAATKVPYLKSFVPSVDGFSPFGVLTFFAVYLVARTSRLCEKKIKTKWLIVATVISGAFCWFGFYHYNSPFALIFAGSMFYLFKRMPCLDGKGVMSKAVRALSPSMFSVYLLHTNVFGFNMLRAAEDKLVGMGWNYYVMAFVVAVGIFVSCLVLDIPRRLLVGLVARKGSNAVRAE